jgi:inorganic triphosphatase YgiF
MAVETELKFRIPARSLKALPKSQIAGGKVGERTETDLVSTYFDTGKHKLKRHGLSLRVRQDGEKQIQTVKWANAAQFGRGEWETEIADDVPDLGKADGTPLEQFALKKLRRKLKPIFKTSVHRITLPVRTKGSEIELAIDLGSIIAGRRSNPVKELELELKSGRLIDLFRLQRRSSESRKPSLICSQKPSGGMISPVATTSTSSSPKRSS